MPTPRSTKQFFSVAARQWKDLVHRIVSLLERERRAQIIAVIALSVICTSVVAESVLATRTKRQKWASTVSVVVLTSDVAANSLLTSANTQQVTLPLAVISSDALSSLPNNTRTRVALTANTPLTQSLVIPSSDAIQIPSGWRVIALPQDITTPHLDPGDQVDVIIGESVVSPDSVVISLKPLSIAVPAEVVPTVTAASRVGEVFIASR
jgi:hypothetical protein